MKTNQVARIGRKGLAGQAKKIVIRSDNVRHTQHPFQVAAKNIGPPTIKLTSLHPRETRPYPPILPDMGGCKCRFGVVSNCSDTVNVGW